MSEALLSEAAKLTSMRPLSVEIRFDGGDREKFAEWLAGDFIYAPQGSGDLGIRMGRSIEDAFNAGVKSAVLVGADIPDLTARILNQAFELLKENDLVIGPAKDGGYYLIGIHNSPRRPKTSKLFSNMEWGTKRVLKKTLKVAKREGYKFVRLPTLRDVDRPNDLHIWVRARGRITPDKVRKGSISVVIPALNEGNNIAGTIESILKSSDDRVEIIVVDGGSGDDTVKIAESLGVKVLRCPPPRASQMNYGAKSAAGEILLFLHADTKLPGGFRNHIYRVLSRPGVVAGSFKLSIEGPGLLLRLVEYNANFRSRCLKLPYGDQGIFLCASLFRDIGGFREIPIMEDYGLIDLLRKGGDIAIVPETVLTSNRRWENLGVLKTTLINQAIIIAYKLGVPPEKIHGWYRREDGVKS